MGPKDKFGCRLQIHDRVLFETVGSVRIAGKIKSFRKAMPLLSNNSTLQDVAVIEENTPTGNVEWERFTDEIQRSN